MNTKTLLFALLSLTFLQCKNNAITNTFKLHENDPFKNTIVPSQTFTIDSKQDNVVEGENGTVLVCPKGCFINTKGEIVEDNVTIELSEALSIEDMLLSNLTTSSEGKQLETDGMIYFNATSKGEQLGINEDNPIHIEIPTKEKKAGMMAYKGTRDEKGNMNWIEPKALDNYLVTVDIHSLDFLPPGFETEVDKGMPYKNHKTATQDLTDSLFYQLAVYKGDSRIIDNIDTQYIEPYKNKSKQVIKDEYTPDSYQEHSTEESVHESSTPETTCGIDPASIKVIKSEKYQNTFIATREFEARLKIIFKTCNKAVLETYLNNLNLNLYEVDNLAANTLGESNHYYENFVNFAKQQLTKVQQADKYAELLKGYYGKQLLKVKSELEMEQEKLMKVLKKKNLEAQKVAEDYKKLLWKREKYRMETYGFNWSETGWINIDNGTLPKSWESKVTEGIYVDNGQEFDRVYCYYVFTSIKSLYRLNTTNNIEFYAVNYDQGKEMLMPKDGTAILISIGYKGQTPSIDIKEFDLNLPINYHLTLATSTIEQVKEAIKPFEKYAQENKINKDLEFMAKFYQEEQRQKELIQETEFMRKLWTAAFPCCAGPQAAATLEY